MQTCYLCLSSPAERLSSERAVAELSRTGSSAAPAAPAAPRTAGPASAARSALSAACRTPGHATEPGD